MRQLEREDVTIVQDLTLAVNTAIENAFPAWLRALVFAAIIMIAGHTAYDIWIKSPTDDLAFSLIRTDVAKLKSQVDMRRSFDALTKAVETLNERLEGGQDVSDALQAVVMQRVHDIGIEDGEDRPKEPRP